MTEPLICAKSLGLGTLLRVWFLLGGGGTDL